MSVEHGDLKIKINSGFQNSEFVLTYAGVRTIRNNNYSYDVSLGHPESGIIIIRTVEASTGSSYSEFFFEKFGIRTFFFKMVDRKLKNLDETSKRGFCLNCKPPITFIC